MESQLIPTEIKSVEARVGEEKEVKPGGCFHAYGTRDPLGTLAQSKEKPVVPRFADGRRK